VDENEEAEVVKPFVPSVKVDIKKAVDPAQKLLTNLCANTG
jgi:hypothetical protein